MVTITRRDVIEKYILFKSSKTFEEVVTCFKNEHEENYEICMDAKEISLFKNHFMVRWKKAHKMKERFINKNKEWLSAKLPLIKRSERIGPQENPSNFHVNEGDSPQINPSNFLVNEGERSKRRKTQHLR
ncbi:unnamed protein product, partial [Meganyctiphanes norvegica]